MDMHRLIRKPPSTSHLDDVARRVARLIRRNQGGAFAAAGLPVVVVVATVVRVRCGRGRRGRVRSRRRRCVRGRTGGVGRRSRTHLWCRRRSRWSPRSRSSSASRAENGPRRPARQTPSHQGAAAPRAPRRAWQTRTCLDLLVRFSTVFLPISLPQFSLHLPSRGTAYLPLPTPLSDHGDAETATRQRQPLGPPSASRRLPLSQLTLDSAVVTASANCRTGQLNLNKRLV